LSPIHITSEKLDGDYTYNAIASYDLHTDQNVAVVKKSSGIGLFFTQDQKSALGTIRKKRQSGFGKKK